MLAAAFEAVPVAKAHTWVGVAGAMTTLSAVAQRLREYDPAATHLSRLSVKQVRGVMRELLSVSHAERAGIVELVVSEHDILDGIALSLA